MPPLRANNTGLVAITAVIIIMSALMVYSLSAALLHADELAASQSWLFSAKSVSRTSSCVDNVLSRLRNNSAVSGNVNININGTVCDAIISGSGNIRNLNVSATTSDSFNSNIVHRVNVNVNINTNPFTISEYKDILE